ncbi:MAG: carboxypeptidase-like regulatory domain-containing protein [Planctomycetota bacterium]
MVRSRSTLWVLGGIAVLGAVLVAASALLVAPAEPKRQASAPEEAPPRPPLTVQEGPPAETPIALPFEPPPVTRDPTHAERRPLSRVPSSDGTQRLELLIHDETTGDAVTFFLNIWCVPAEKGDVVEYARLHPTQATRLRPLKGRFVLPYLKPGRYNLLARSSGYEDFVLQGLDVPSPDPVKILVSRGAHVEGRVVDGSGLPVPNIQVFINPKQIFDNRPPPRVRLRETDAGGHFLFTTLPPGRYTLAIGSTSQNETEEFVLQEKQRYPRDLFLTLQNTLRFTVTDTLGQPLNNASIRLWGHGSSRSIPTDRNGIAELRYVAAGSYSVKVSLRGFESKSEQITVYEAGLQDFRIALNATPR